MLQYMEAHTNVGILMPKILNTDGSIQRLCKLLPTPVDLLLRLISPKSLRDRSNKDFELHRSGYDKIMFVPYLSGCFMLIRADALKRVGDFDERFFMYPEDIDLTRRVAMFYETLFYPECALWHEHHASSKKSVRMLVVHIINMIKYFNKWGWLYDEERAMLNSRTLAQFTGALD